MGLASDAEEKAYKESSCLVWVIGELVLACPCVIDVFCMLVCDVLLLLPAMYFAELICDGELHYDVVLCCFVWGFVLMAAD